MSMDVIAELRANDPARRARLDAVDPGVLGALREGITMTDRATIETRPDARPEPALRGARRVGKRGALVGGLAVVLAGGGVAYAASQLWTDEEGAATNPMGIECQEVFGVGFPNEGATVASTLTGDPVADCEIVRADEGLDPIADPVAFILDGTMYVTPRDQVPAGADVLDVEPALAAVFRELQASIGDVVDGGLARCLSADDAAGWLETEFARLGLSGWSVEVLHGADGEGSAPCAGFSIGDKPQTVRVFPEMEPRVEDWLPVAELEAYRAIPASCMTVDDAVEAAVAAMGDQPHYPVVRVVDESAACSRIDVEMRGGGPLATVYGPSAD